MAAWESFCRLKKLQGEWWVCCGPANVFHLGLLCWKMNLVPTYLTMVFNGQVTFCYGLVVVHRSKNESTIKVKTSSQLPILYSLFFLSCFSISQISIEFFLRCLYLHSRWLSSTQTLPFVTSGLLPIRWVVSSSGLKPSPWSPKVMVWNGSWRWEYQNRHHTATVKGSKVTVNKNGWILWKITLVSDSGCWKSSMNFICVITMRN